MDARCGELMIISYVIRSPWAPDVTCRYQEKIPHFLLSLLSSLIVFILLVYLQMHVGF